MKTIFLFNWAMALSLLCQIKVTAEEKPMDLRQLAFPGADFASIASMGSTSPLTLMYARTWGNPRAVEVVYSLPVQEATATNTSNYRISGGVTVSRAIMGTNSYSVLLTTTPMSDSVAHLLTVNNVLDQSTPPNALSANSRTPILKAQGMITRKLFTGIPYSGLGGLTNNAKFPNNPDASDFQANAESPQNMGDNYGVQLVGYVHPPVTGDYTFFVASDDQGTLFLSLDDNPGHKIAVASVPSAVGYRAWLTFTNQQSAYFRLEAGKRYYLEALMAEGGGSDNLSVTWRMRGMLPPNTGDAPIPGEFLSSAMASGPVGIAVQPQSITVNEGHPATFGVVPNGSPYYSYQWRRNGIPIPGANGSSFTLSSAQSLDNGAAFSVIVNNSYSSITSSVATLTVAQDVTPPVIVRLSGGATMDRVFISFSEPVASITANDARNYSLDGGLGILDARLQTDQTNVVITTTRQTSGQSYTLTVSGVTDISSNHNAANDSSIFVAWVLSRGFLHRDVYYSVGTGGAVSDLTSNARFPDNPDVIGEITSFETPNNIADGYGQRLLGLLEAPTTGYYTFYVASDDQSFLYLSTNDDPANKMQLAYEPQWNGSRQYRVTDRRNPSAPENVSLPIWLTAGQRYYVEVLMKEANGGDNLAVTWQMPGASAPLNGDPPIDAPYLYCYANPLGASLVITQQPLSVALIEAAYTNFTVGITSTAPQVFYQWQKNGVDIPNANSAAYTTPRLFRDDQGARFRCLVSIPGTNLVSAEATVAITLDTQAPQVVSAATLAGNTNLGLCFSELMDPASVTNPANYNLSYGAKVTSVILRPDGQSVGLAASGLCFTNFTLTLNNLKDLSGNLLPPNSIVPVSVVSMESLDVGTAGDPAIPGSTYACSANNFDLVAGGSFVWNNADHFQFACELREGNFDVQVRIARLDRADQWSAAGIMARENLTPGSRFLWGAVNTPAGANAYGHGYRAVQDGPAAAWPGWGSSSGVPVPNAWLRLKREGDIFTTYRGTNGVDWAQFAQISNNLPSRLFVGLAATANNKNGSTIAWFRDYTSTPVPLPVPPVDLLVKTFAEPSSAFALNNAYQVQPTGAQVRMTSARTNMAGRLVVRVENDSTQSLSPVLRVSESSEPNWAISYFEGATDISSQIRSPSGYTLTNLSGGGFSVITVDLLPVGRALGNAMKTTTLSVFRDSFSTSPRDRVQVVAYNEPTYQPDMMVRRLSDVVYLGDNVYNATGTNQSTSQKLEPGTSAIYPLLLANDGNLTNYFTVRGTSGSSGWSVRYFDAVSAGAEITADVTSSGTLVALAPGASWEFHAEILPDLTVARGTSNTVLVTATSLADQAMSDTVKMITITKTVTNVPQDRLYTTDNDFAEGTMIGTVAHNNQLELSAESITPPYIWVPNSSESTVSKVDIRTGKELGRYRTGPANAGNGNPSRTTVDQHGNCWVANRNHGTVVKIGLYENGQYFDRNGDGLIQTSRDLDNDGNISASEVLDWGKDECVLWEIVIIPGKEGTFAPGTYTGGYGSYNDAGTRSIAADQWGNVWAGNFTAKRYYFLENSAGTILRTNDLTDVNHSPYGAVVDAQGILWSAGAGQQQVLRLNPADNSTLLVNLGHHAYGLGLDRHNHLFVSGWESSTFSRINVLTAEKEWTRAGIYQSRGVAVTRDGDVWVANSGPGTVARWSNDGVLKTTISVGTTPTGVSIDSEGKVWVVNLGDGLIRRIDPDIDAIILTKQINAMAGGAAGHYGYSDMTGNVARNATTRYGQWIVVHDAQVEYTQWGTLTWHALEPAGSNVTVRVRSSQDQGRWSNWETAQNGVLLSATPPDRYLQVEVAMWALAGQDLPVFYDLTVTPLPQRTSDLALGLQSSPSVATNEQQITYTTLVTNLGPQDARSVWIVNHLPTGVSVAAITNSLGNISSSSGEIRCEIGSLPAGSNVSLIIVVDLKTSGILTNFAAVSHYEKDLVPQNNSAVAITPVAAIPCLTPPAGLVGWWPGEGNAIDLVGTNHGALVGNVGFVSGRVGQAFSLNGSSAWVDLGRVSPGSKWSLEAWVKPSAILSDRRVILGCHADCRDWSLLLNNGEIGVNIGRGACVAIVGSGITAVTGVWYHVVGTCDGTNAAIYVNGQLRNSGPVNLNYVGSSSSFRIGSSVCCGEYFAGLVDEPSLYNRALSSQEVLGLYAALGSGKCWAAVQPQLHIGRAPEKGRLLLWWSTDAVGFQLKSAPTVKGPWNSVGTTPVVQETNYVVPVLATDPAQFFQLRNP